jgi:hypothetical protein
LRPYILENEKACEIVAFNHVIKDYDFKKKDGSMVRFARLFFRLSGCFKVLVYIFLLVCINLLHGSAGYKHIHRLSVLLF